MKYEMIFGDEKLFDGAPWDSVCVERFINPEQVSVYVHYRTIDALLNTLIERKAVSCASNRPDTAMRSIIKEPKRWTWGDKKAGVLPEVGAKCSHCHSVDERTVLSVTDKYVGIERDNSDMNPYFVTHAEFLQYYIPIETPEEKAARLRDEWCRECKSKLYPRGSDGFPERIYDALLSGDLPVPVKEQP